MILLSICIPTYNRANYLKEVLESIVDEKIFKETDFVEIVISDNCSADYTQELCSEYINKYGSKIRYKRQAENILDKNFIEVLYMAHGKYAKLNNDTLVWLPGALTKAVNYIQKQENADIVFFANGAAKKDIEYRIGNMDALLDNISFLITWIGGFCVKTEALRKIENPDRFSRLMLAQVDIIARLITQGNGAYVYNAQLFYVIGINKKGGYSVAEVFGKNYMLILNQLVDCGQLSRARYNEEMKQVLLKHIVVQSFASNYSFDRKNYVKNLKEWHGKHYFYCSFIKAFKLRYMSPIGENIKYIVSLLFSKSYWRQRNRNNKTYLIKNGIDISRLRKATRIGENTTGPLDIEFSPNDSCRLILGSNCSIGKNVKFILNRVHMTSGTQESDSKRLGPIIIKDNVKIGDGTMIYPNVVIGEGSEIAPNSIVTENII